LFFPDLTPVLCLPLAGLPAVMGMIDPSQTATLDVEIDLRSDAAQLRRLVPCNPQLRFHVGARLSDKPFTEPERSHGLVAACPSCELVELVELIRDARGEDEASRDRVFSSPLAIWLLGSAPKPKVSLVVRGDRTSGALSVEGGELMLSRKLVVKDKLFNTGELEDSSWDEEKVTLSLKGPGFSFRVQAEKDSAELACLRGYLMELVDARRQVWEPQPSAEGVTPAGKPEPIGELLHYHFDPCNDPLVSLFPGISHNLVDQFMEGFGQLIGSAEMPRGMVLLSKDAPCRVGLLFTERAVYARGADLKGERVPFEKLTDLAQSRKRLLSSTLNLGNVSLKLDALGKETIKALDEVLKNLPRRVASEDKTRGR
jgi:hypothetical protein